MKRLTVLFALLMGLGLTTAEAQPTLTVPLDLPAGATPLELVRIEPGTFTMGTPSSTETRWIEEYPPHEVTLTKPYYIGRFEVTQAQWSTVVGGNPSYYDSGPNHPVERVSWDDAQEFVRQLNDMNLGLGTFRLPTEAEWEYAYQAGTDTEYYWGDDPNYAQIDEYAWHFFNSPRVRHQPVGLKPPNDFGLYDMAGNVYEWMLDSWIGAPDRGPQVDPVDDTNDTNKVLKGGSFAGNRHRCRGGWRYLDQRGQRYFAYGMRLALTPAEVEESGKVNVEEWRVHEARQ